MNKNTIANKLILLFWVIAISTIITLTLTKANQVFAVTELTPVFEFNMDNDIVNYDSVSKSNIGTLVGNPTISDGKMYLNGSSGLLLDNVDTSGGFTIEFDFMRPATSKPSSTAYEMIIGKNSYNGVQNDNREWGVFVTRTSNGTMAIKVNVHSDSTSNNWNGVGSGTYGLTYDEYHHVKVQSTQREIWLFVDDTCYGTYAFTRDNTNQPIRIGHTQNASLKNDQFFTGYLDNIKLSLGVEDAMQNKIKQESLDLRYNFEYPDLSSIKDVTDKGNNANITPTVNTITPETSRFANGIEGNGIYLNGSNVIQTPYSLDLSKNFTVSLYFKIDKLTGSDQVIIGQANYANSMRDFTVYINPSNILTVNVKKNSQNNADGWIVTRVGDIKANVWYNFVMTVENNQLTTYLNGYKAAINDITNHSFSGTHMTLGGVISGEKPMQLTAGHYDELTIYSKALKENEIYSQLSNNLELVGQKNGVQIATNEIYDTYEKLQHVDFTCVSKSILDGYKWQHGGTIAYYNNLFYASWGRNTGHENSAGEEMVCYTSLDGKNWTYNQNFVAEEGYAYSHGNIFEAEGKLYMMSPYYAGSSHGTVSSSCIFHDLKMHGFVLNNNGLWDKLDFVLPHFRPLQQAY